jgi:tRNA nucleotidyltransferase/poly(A) polymerase
MIAIEDLPKPQRRAFDQIRETAVDKHCKPYLVGGPVRDLIIGRTVIDLDYTLEEDASTLARAVARRVEGRVRSFPQFLTYKITANGLPDIDIATARRERYRAPGALPTVTAGKLRDDLLRRDFSINAIAYDVLGGQLHDPTGGLDDLRTGVIRVLHDTSFVDDPTRIFRAIRLATRLGFTFDPHTNALMEAALAAGALLFVSKERLWRELFFAFDEDDAPEVVLTLWNIGVLDFMFGPRPIDPSRLDRAQKQLEKNPTLDREVLFTAALLNGNASPVDLEGSGFSQKRARNVIQIANELPRFADALAEAKNERQRLRVLRHASHEMLSVLASTLPKESRTVARYAEYQQFKLPLRGTDLEVPLGPHIARALERTREAVFTGEIDPAQARSFAKEVALRYLERGNAESRMQNAE